MYSFAKFLADHLFLQNREKNIKNHYGVFRHLAKEKIVFFIPQVLQKCGIHPVCCILLFGEKQSLNYLKCYIIPVKAM
jgi:hypothetical protein